ncbi:Fumarylacetoacetase [Thozetella sp. PMI_491]|nr:Fumarylacetoacetase [Thozetella sp. PMI_491]
MASWVPISQDSDFSIQNLPYGIFSFDGSDPRIGVAIGEYVLDMRALAQDQVFADLGFDTSTLKEARLNKYADLGKPVNRSVRERLQQLLKRDTEVASVLRDNPERRQKVLIPISDVQMHLPMEIGDYTDFFVGLHHAQNVRLSIESICPSYYSLPTGYHGRSSSVIVSDESFIKRPQGQFKVDQSVEFGPTRKLDFEAEFAAFIGRGNEMGTPVDVDEAEDHIFGFVLMNDWSARDIQMWEASLMGPLNGKNFATTVSPWVVPPEALEQFRVPAQKPLLPYLTQKRTNSVYDIPIRVSLQVGSERYRIAECNTKNVIFSFAQMIAHHTRGGCPLRTGDLIATGTLSGSTQGELGCLLELSRDGVSPHSLESESSPKRILARTYLEDGDTVEFRARVGGLDGEGAVGFGVCKGRVLSSI